jgi:predicted nucleotidyltransferase
MKKQDRGRDMTDLMLEQLKSFFNNESDLELAFLIGSYAKGTARKDSDVDVAVLFSSTPSSSDILDLNLRLSAVLKKEVDLVVLNTAGPIIKMQTLKTGIIIYRTKNTYEDFFTRTLYEYEDLKYYRQEIEKNILGGRIYA